MVSLGSPQGNVTAEKIPAVKLADVGDTIVGRVIDAKYDVPQKDYDTGMPKLNRQGNPVTQYLITLKAMDGTTAKAGSAKVYEPIIPGDIVSLWVAGLDKYNPDNAQCFSSALQAFGELSVGDVVRGVLAKEIPHSNVRYNAIKVREFAFRHPKPEEGDAVREAELLYQSRQAQTSLGSPAQTPLDEDF